MGQLVKKLLGVLIGTALLSGCDSGGSGGSNNGSDPAPTITTVTLSGTLLSDPVLDVDSDINDPEAAPQPNDSLSAPQTLAVGSEVRGFVTRQATSDLASQDNFAVSNDVSDFFEATIAAGQDIIMTFADYQQFNPSTNDIDLYLYSSAGVLINGSILITSPTEQVTVSQEGTYFIEVRAFSGSSNYSLSINEAEQIGPQSSGQVNLASMAPRRATAMNRDVSSFSSALSSLNASPSSFATTSASEADRPHALWLKTPDLPMAKEGPFSSRFPLAGVLGLELSDDEHDPRHEQKLALLHHIKQVNSLAGEDLVKPYHYPRTLADPPQNPVLQWNLPTIEWEEALDEVEIQAPAIGRPLIAVIDSGVFSSHPKIAPVLTDARDFVPAFIDGDAINDADAVSSGGNAAEADENVALGDANPDDCYSFHGTHVASIAVAPSAGGTIDGINMDGVLPFADLMMLKVGNNISPDCGFIVGDIAGAIRYAAGLPNSSGVLPTRPADVINMSFGGPEPDPATQAAIEDAVAAGVILVAAAGNAGEDGAPQPEFPASFSEVFAVAATDINNERAFYSSFYQQVEITAPGGDGRFDTNGDFQADAILGAIASENTGGTAFEADYALYQGTSMAAPHVAAGFALMKAIFPGLDTDEARRVLEEGFLTTDIAAPGRDDSTGYGLMSLKKMVDTAVGLRDGTLVVPADFRITPSSLAFGSFTTSATIEVTRSGDPTFTISSVTMTNGGLPASVTPDPTPVTVDADGFGTYQVAINRTDAAPGDYNVEVEVTSSEGATKTVPLSFSVPLQSTLASTAPTRVFLQREQAPGVFTTLSTSVAPNGAGSTITFSSLEPGNYRVLYTTDMDNDGQICDGGELGGSFPGGDCESTETISLTTDTAGFEFVLTRLDN
ncbi:MAG: S8 family serine peptidase [Pseudomonadota bacterium]